METAIALLLLAYSLLAQVKATPDTPQELRIQAEQVAQVAISAATKELASQVSTPARVAPVEDGTLLDMSIEVYKLDREEENTAYYRGDKEIVSATLNGEPAQIVLSKELPEGSCVHIWVGGVRQAQPKCGGFMARIALSGEGTLKLIAADESFIEQAI